MSKRAKLVIIDGKAIFHRAYHAIPHLSNKDGVPTNAVYGFAAMTLKALSDLKPDYVVLAWDKAKTSLTQRMALYPDYKVKRLKMPDDFYAQIPLIAELATALRMPMIELDHYEADDIIGTLVQRHPELEILIATNDRDMFQMINDHTRIYMQRRGMTDTEIYDTDKVMERYGIAPRQIIDLKALEGDTSDNIPGVPGVGEKTALDLIKKYKSLDGIYEHLDEIPGKLQDKLRDNKELAYLSHKLATIMCNAPVALKLEDARWGNPDRQAIHELFRRLNFKSLLRNLPPELDTGGGPPSLFDAQKPEKKREHIEKANYRCVQTKADLERLIAELNTVQCFAFDVETDGIDVMTASLVGLSVSFKEGEAYYVPVGHTSGEQLDIDWVVAALKPVLEKANIGKVGHNLKFDYQIMRRLGVKLAPIAHDTMIAAFILNPLGRAQTLSDLAYSELGLELIEITELLGRKGKDQISFDAVTVEDATRYAAEDADVSWRLYQKLQPELEAAGLNKLAAASEWPLIPVLGDMELAGIELDVEFLKQFNLKISAKILELEEAIWQASGEHFNISSPAQLGKVLYDKLGLTAAGVKRGKTGASSTAAGELEKLRGQHPVIDYLFEYRELVKLKNTYVDALPKQVGPDGRVHTSFSQTIAQTGRLSSTNPNLQNIPIRTEVGREIRKAFVAPKGRILVSADYSQIELRVAAALAGDQNMINAFRDGIDVHQQTAAELYGVPLDKVEKKQRYNAKTINFGVLYGMSPHGLSVATGMSREEAVKFIQRYYELRPQLKSYIEKVKADARKNEYVETLLGRRRPCAEINSNNFVISNAAERMAVNVPIQGTAADIMKLAMVALDAKLDNCTQMLLQIHDELIVETDLDKAEEVENLMREVMENVYELGVPLDVETVSGTSWGMLG